MTLRSLVRLRLGNQGLVGSTCRTPLDVVTRLGAVQSQDYGPATWGLALRAPGLTRVEVDRAFDAGEIVRTHALRQTWHFVPPADLRWMLALTAPRLRAAERSRFAALGLDEAMAARSRRTIERALGEGMPLTRADLADRMARKGMRVERQQSYHLVLDAELCGMICSGPRRGREFTYALVEERVPPAPAVARDEALAMLARRYFSSHGPASLRDFAWWSGLTMGDVRRAVGTVGGTLERVQVDGSACFMTPPGAPAARRTAVAHLLPCFDEYTVAYRDRRALVDGASIDGLPSGALLTDLVVVDGTTIGTWRRTSSAGQLVVEVTPTRPFGRTERRLVEREACRFGVFAGRPVEARIHSIDRS